MLHNSALRRIPYVPQILAPFLRAVGALSDGRLEEAFQQHKDAFMCVRRLRSTDKDRGILLF